MSLAQGYVWTHRQIRLIGYSVAGTATSIVFPDADVCFDVGPGMPYQIPVSNLLITHGHMDHASGLPYIIGQKAMMGQTPPNVFMPMSLVKPMRTIMRLWEEIDGHTYQYQFHGVAPGESRDLKGHYFLRAFETYHRVDSQGYTIFERKKKLKPEYANVDPRQLGDLRKSGAELETTYEEPVISFSGDTKIEFLDNPTVRESKVIVMEVTYWDQKKSVENARLWGHIHLDELIPRLESLKCEKLVLIHASARYTTPYLKQIMEARIPEHWKHRVDLFPRPL